LGSRSHWFCSQTFRWRTRIIGITTTLIIACTTTGRIDRARTARALSGALAVRRRLVVTHCFS
jgi:hypothetical protein